ncbi:MAG: hypothetical protein ACRDSP_11040 [Pseudonocardiaceae bacterium]
MISSSTRDESFRATLRVRSPEGGFATVIITRRGLGQAARVWVTFDGAIKTTAVMTDPETGELVEMLGKATMAR